MHYPTYLKKEGPGEHATLNPQTPILLSLPVLETYLLHLDRGPLQSLLKNFSFFLIKLRIPNVMKAKLKLKLFLLRKHLVPFFFR